MLCVFVVTVLHMVLMFAFARDAILAQVACLVQGCATLLRMHISHGCFAQAALRRPSAGMARMRLSRVSDDLD